MVVQFHGKNWISPRNHTLWLTVKEQARLDSALDAANRCGNQECRKGAAKALRKISDKLAMAIDDAVAKVCSVLNQFVCS